MESNPKLNLSGKSNLNNQLKKGVASFKKIS